MGIDFSYAVADSPALQPTIASRRRIERFEGDFMIFLIRVSSLARRIAPIIAFALLGVSAASASTNCTEYNLYFDAVLEKVQHRLDREAASGDGRSYYSFSYSLDGVIAMFEGSRDAKYLQVALTWAERMTAAAAVVDYDGRRNWNGTWLSRFASERITHQLYEFQGAPPLSRLARLILTNSELKERYGERAESIYRFVKDNVIDKWLARSGEETFRRVATTGRGYPDTAALFARALLNIAAIDSNAAYMSLARDMVDGFTSRLVPYRGGSLIWGLGDSPEMPGQTLDTSHANRHPYLTAEAYEAGLVTRVPVDGLARLLTEVIWNKSVSNPRFTNLIDGTDPTIGDSAPSGIGQIYAGWAALGAHDQRARLVVESTLRAIIAGVRNPSLDYMNHPAGRMALAGHTARNNRYAGLCD
jgi:hypothetical protein